MNIASITPETRAPASRPARAVEPRTTPTSRGTTTAIMPGTSISFRAEVVEMATQVL